MSDPWFDPNYYAWLPGTVYGTTLGIFGGLSGYLASAGKAKRFCLSVWLLYAVTAVAFLAISLFAYFSGQPYGIWYGFGLPAVLGIVLVPSLIPTLLRQYRAAEERRMHAADFDRP